MIAYPDDFKTAVVEFACEKLDLRRWTVKEDRPARLGEICRSRNRHVPLYAVTMGVIWITASPLRWKNRGKSSNMPTPKITAEILNAAILGMEAQKEKLDAKIAELRRLLTWWLR